MQQGATDPAEVLERFQSGVDLVAVIAGQFAGAFGGAVNYEDLLGAGREGLYDAARLYHPSRGVPFRAYANFRIRGAVIDDVRRSSHLPRRAYYRLRALEAAMLVTEGEADVAFATPKQGIAPGAAEARLGRHLASVATAAAMGTAIESGAPSSSGIPDEATNPEQQLARAELLDLISRSIDDLSPDEAGVVRAFYFEDKSLTEIAESYNMSRSWICRLHAHAMARLTKRIKGNV